MHRRNLITLAACFLSAAQLFAGYAARVSWLPVVGRATGFAGRGFYTTLYLTNTSDASNSIVLSFFASAQPRLPPRTVTIRIAARETRVVDVGPQLAGGGGGIGALQIRSSDELIAEARVFSRGAGQAPGTEVGTVLHAIPAHFAIGTAESSLIHTPVAAGRSKLYAVETKGFPLSFAVKPMPSTAQGTERRLYLSAHEQRSWDVAELFPGAEPAALQLTGINGSGRIIALGTSIAAQSQDFNAFEMSLPERPRHRAPWPELLAYTAVAIALALAALYGMKKPGLDKRQSTT